MGLWLKQYFVLFTDLRNFSPTIWLIIPLFVYVLLTFKKRKRWERILFFVFTLSYFILSIGGKGYVRYNLTLYPFAIASIFYYSWELIKNKNNLFKILTFIALGVVIGFNCFQNNDYYGFYWRYKIATSDDYFPKKLFKYINHIQDLDFEKKVLICSHRHLFFYHTDNQGIDYRDPVLEQFSRQKNKEQAFNLLKNSLRIKYILLHRENTPSLHIQSIINNDCDLVIQEKGFKLFRLHDREQTKEDLEKYFVNESLIKNGSFENWSLGPEENPDFFESGDNVVKGMIVREQKDVRVGQYSVRIQGDNFNFTQEIPNFKNYCSKNISCFVWIKTKTPNKYRIQIYDGVYSSFSDRHSGTGKWELLQANHSVDPSATNLSVRIIQAEKTGNSDDYVVVDGALLVEGNWNTFFLYRMRNR